MKHVGLIFFLETV